MAAKKKTETPIQETVAEVVEKVKTARKKATTAKGTKKTTTKGGKTKQGATKAPAKVAEPTPIKKMDKKDQPATPQKAARDAKGRFVKGEYKGGPGRPKGVTNQLLSLAREAAMEIWPNVLQAARNGEKWAVQMIIDYGMPRTKPLAADPDMLNEKGRELLQEYLDGRRTLKDTALLMDMNGIPLPQTIEILLRKEEQIPDDPTGGQYSTMSSEEMERLVAERKAKAKAQEDGIPSRREAISELYKAMEGKDSFAPGATPTRHDNEGEE